MPELPEVETVCRTLSPLLSGKSISRVEVFWPRTLAHPDVDRFRAEVVGATIEHVERRAKLILIHLDTSGTISVHLRMTGELLFVPEAALPAPDRLPYLRAEIGLGGDRLLFFDVRKFGRIMYLAADELTRIDEAYGIEPLEEEFTPAWLATNLQRRTRQLKPLLLDQTFIAGLGNIYVDEALFKAGLHPLTSSASVSREQAAILRDAIVDTLSGALSRRGTTLRDYRSGLGESGENRGSLLVYGSPPGSPCPCCGSPLTRLIVGQRGSIFCPACQPAPSASG